jgi:hypothetical protein
VWGTIASVSLRTELKWGNLIFDVLKKDDNWELQKSKVADVQVHVMPFPFN